MASTPKLNPFYLSFRVLVFYVNLGKVFIFFLLCELLATYL